MSDDTDRVAIEAFVRLKPKIYFLWVDDNSEHKKAKDVNKNVAAITSYNEYRDVFLNNNFLRHSMIRVQSKKTEWEFMKSTQFHYFVLMTKYISKTMNMIY